LRAVEFFEIMDILNFWTNIFLIDILSIYIFYLKSIFLTLYSTS